MLGSSLPSQQIGPFRELTLLASHGAISSEALQHPAAPPRCFLRVRFEPAPLAESCLMTCPETLQDGFLALLSLAVALLLYGEGLPGRHGVIFSGGSQEERCWGRVLGPHPPPGEAEEGAGFWQRESWAHLPVSLLSFTACFQGP